jgi:mutator protein MutT
VIHVAAAVCIRHGKVLLASRPEDKPPAGWEFPGGKLEPGETPQSAAVRELREELDWEVIPLDIIYRIKRPGIILYFVRVIPGNSTTPRPCENQQVKWVDLTPQFPEDMLENDREFWNFLTSR